MAADPDAAFFTDEVRCPVQVGDLAAALLELAGDDRAGLLHVAGADRRHAGTSSPSLLAPGRRPAPRAPRVADSGPRQAARLLAVDRARARLLRTRLRGAREVLEGRGTP